MGDGIYEQVRFNAVLYEYLQYLAHSLEARQSKEMIAQPGKI